MWTSHSTVPPIVTKSPYDETPETTPSNTFPTSSSDRTFSLSSLRASLSERIILLSSSSNNNGNSQQAISYIAEKAKPKNYQISSSSNNYTNTSSHQGISFIAEKPKYTKENMWLK